MQDCKSIEKSPLALRPIFGIRQPAKYSPLPAAIASIYGHFRAHAITHYVPSYSIACCRNTASKSAMAIWPSICVGIHCKCPMPSIWQSSCAFSCAVSLAFPMTIYPISSNELSERNSINIIPWAGKRKSCPKLGFLKKHKMHTNRCRMACSNAIYAHLSSTNPMDRFDATISPIYATISMQTAILPISIRHGMKST